LATTGAIISSEKTRSPGTGVRGKPAQRAMPSLGSSMQVAPRSAQSSTKVSMKAQVGPAPPRVQVAGPLRPMMTVGAPEVAGWQTGPGGVAQGSGAQLEAVGSTARGRAAEAPIELMRPSRSQRANELPPSAVARM